MSKKNLNVLFIAMLLMITLPELCQAQSSNIYTLMPFLRVNPDARTRGLGETGIASEVNTGSIFHNASKLAFADKKLAFALGNVPFGVGNGTTLSLTHLMGYGKISPKDVIGFSARRIADGEISITDITGTVIHTHTPSHLAIDLSYSRKLSDRFALGITAKYATSDLFGEGNIDGISFNAAKTLAFDLSCYNRNKIKTNTIEGYHALGVAITNIGNKVSYSDDSKEFIPTNLGIGNSLNLVVARKWVNNLSFDVNKLLVPSPDSTSLQRKNLFSGMLGSFSDAPGGASEELQEIMFSFGYETGARIQLPNDKGQLDLLGRVGYFGEHEDKGNRKYWTTGFGLDLQLGRMNWGFDLARLITNTPVLANFEKLTYSMHVGFGI